jgi:3-phytase
MRPTGTFAAALIAAFGLAPGSAAQTVTVAAQAETVPVGTANDDAADDPAIWRNARKPADSLIVATDKKAGLYVYGLDGKTRSFTPAGHLNNVDLVDMGRHGVIVVASDRNDKAAAVLQVYRLDTRKGELVRLGAVAGGAGEAYGLCLQRRGRQLHAFSVLKHGTIHHVRIPLNSLAAAETLRTLKLATQTEGCVVDPRTDTLYVGEEARGVWAFGTRPASSSAGKLVAAVDGKQLVADVEGLAIFPRGRRGGWLIVSSQGDNAFARYSLPGLELAGRFRIGAGAYGSVEETDGIEIRSGSFGKGFPDGLFVAQDGHNEPSAQNFKLVSWREIMRALQQTDGQSRN